MKNSTESSQKKFLNSSQEQCFIPVILAIQEVEIRWIVVQASLVLNVKPIQKIIKAERAGGMAQVVALD
jgi:hypothetical protein